MNATAPISTTHYSYQSFAAKLWDPDTANRIKNIAKKAFDLLVVPTAIAANFAAMTFFSTGLIIPLVFLSLPIACITKLAFQAFGTDQDKLKTNKLPKQAATFNLVHLAGSSGPSIFIHELGHALAALACFKNAKPSISIYPFKGGATEYVVSGPLTSFGTWLGKEGARVFTTAAGIAATTTFATTELLIARTIKKKHPTLSKILTYHAISSLFNDILYGLLSFLSTYTPANDFLYMWKVGGIHPLIPIALMILIPVLVTSTHAICHRKKAHAPAG